MRKTSLLDRLLVCLLALSLVLVTPSPAEQSRDETKTVGFYRVMTSNKGACLPVGSEYRDWIELINFSEHDVDLNGWSIVRNMDIRKRFTFTRRIMRPGESLLLYGGKSVADAPAGTLFLGFNLSSAGVELSLCDPVGAFVSVVEVPAMKSGAVYALDIDTGEWAERAVTDSFATGVPLVSTLSLRDGERVRINELMAKNTVTIRDDTGAYSDWVELYNPSRESVSLSGWSLTDDALAARKFVFPDVTLEPFGYLLVFLTGEEQLEGELHAAFKLSAKGEQVTLFDAEGSIVSRMSFDALAADESMICLSDGTTTVTDRPSPGQENTLEGMLRSVEVDWTRPTENAQGLYINEVAVSVEGGTDWVELVNRSNADIDLSTYYLSDKPNKPRRWQFPEGTVIGAGKGLVVALAGADSDPEKVGDRLAADFKLSVKHTERLLLNDAEGNPVDRILLVNQRRGVSYGRVSGANQYGYFTTPTPGAENDGVWYARAAEEITFSEQGGLTSDAFQLTLSGTPDVPIYYTLDGSAPTAASNLYTGSIQIAENTVVRAIAAADGVLPSAVATRTWIFGENSGMRVICVSGDPEDLIGENGTLVTSRAGHGYDVFAEIYDKDGSPMIAQDCFFKLNGSGSLKMYPQKAFRLVAKKQYGDNRFRAALFDNLEWDEYKAVVIRCGGQDNEAAVMRDAVLTGLAKNTSVVYQECQPVSVYIDGVYWGFYFMRERITAQMLCQHEGWSNDDQASLDILKEKSLSVKQGSKDTWNEMIDYVKKNGVASDDNLAVLRTWLDVENYLEYVMLEMYTDNQDLGNIVAYRNPNADGLWRFVLFDVDLGFRASRDPVEGWLSTKSDRVGSITSQPNVLFKALMQNASCREYFLRRFGELLKTDLSVEAVTARIDAFYDVMNVELLRTCLRWDWSYDKWERRVQGMRNYAARETDKVIAALIKNFKLSDAEAQRYFG